MIDAEVKRKEKGAGLPKLSVESFERAEREGLCKEESIEIFLIWYSFGGADQGFSFTEILNMPVWLRKDLRYIFSELSSRRKQREELAEMGKLYDSNAGRKRRSSGRKR